jgi:hypothetical protein
MRKYSIKTFAAIIGISFILMASCTPGSCFEETNAFVKTTFFLDSTGVKLAPDSLTVYGIGRDTSKIYNKTRNINPALLPLDASTGGCGFVIRINGINDTISFTYSTYPHSISKECGYTFYHTIDFPVYSTNIIDSVGLVKSTITTLSEENIRIYY